MEYNDELEPTPERIAMTLSADDSRAEEAAYERLSELGDARDDHEASQWVKFLRDLDDADSGLVDMEDAQEVDGVGWIEDTHGGAVFVPCC